ncbi:flavodoxin family protein [candidate division WOR-3 bacterium]|nr:flavodoxin family protein [candidate division WOR-3 bacterium]
MKTVVVYYSQYGNSRVAARLIAKQLDAPVHRIEVKKRKGVVTSTFSALFGRRPKIKTIPLQPEDWDLMVIVVPIWSGRPATPLKTFLAETRLAEKKIAAFFSFTSTDIHKRPTRWMKKVLDHFGARLEAVGGYNTGLKQHTVLKQRVWDFLAQLPAEAIPVKSSSGSGKRGKARPRSTTK